MMLADNQIREIITRTVRAELHPCDVRVSVNESEHFDDDDETFYMVTISIGSDCAPDQRKMLGLTRLIRNKLVGENMRESTPMLSFISRSDEQQSGLVFS